MLNLLGNKKYLVPSQRGKGPPFFHVRHAKGADNASISNDFFIVRRKDAWKEKKKAGCFRRQEFVL